MMHHNSHLHGHGHTGPPFTHPHPAPHPHHNPHQPPLPVPQQPTVYSRPEVVGHPTIHHVMAPSEPIDPIVNPPVQTEIVVQSSPSGYVQLLLFIMRPHTPAILAREPGSTRLEMDQIRQCMDNKEPSRVKFRRAEPDPPLLAVRLGSSISSPVYGALRIGLVPPPSKNLFIPFSLL
ncbi:hypothetical protein J6590_047475 [Homalodisca vitripennis]|nr:hypothetical protein J6590_092721 [Homalodisca vitripennis]KAG8283295.1 hypothetical protein J6590_021195 [Homalodisca vitripennis]KAG8336281.1 hypothetical protein J6590_047475 [Homalodisca vitripennis]